MYVRDSFDVPLFVMITRRQTRFTRSLPWFLLHLWTWLGLAALENGFKRLERDTMTFERAEGCDTKHLFFKTCHSDAEGTRFEPTPPPPEQTEITKPEIRNEETRQLFTFLYFNPNLQYFVVYYRGPS
ncbi:hypothetical protein NQD34_008271 [Periophthalmus magnuspinnatus]|nr:hypothetical protein NQD34_008271 [Periophthalmus magnuspinnatus]